MIATKAGLVRPGPNRWKPYGRPEHLRDGVAELKDQGKIRHVGISNVSQARFREAERIVPIVSIQNRFNVADRVSEPLIDLCEHRRSRRSARTGYHSGMRTSMRPSWMRVW